MADQSTALTTRDQQIAALEKTAVTLVIGKVLHDVVQSLVTEGESLAMEMRSIDIVDDDTCALATDCIQRRLGWAKRADEEIRPYIKAAKAVHSQFTGLLDTVVAEGAADAASTKQKRDGYLDEQERLKRQEQVRVSEENAKLEEEARQDAARETIALGGSEESAQQILEERIPLPPPSVAPVATPAGTYGRDNWQWRFSASEVQTLKKIVKLAAKDPERYLKYLSINESAVTSEVKTNKNLAKIPGIEAFNDRKRVDRAK